MIRFFFLLFLLSPGVNSLLAQLTRTNPEIFKTAISKSQFPKTGNEIIIKPNTSYLKSRASSPAYGDTVGYTWYDFQTNGGMQKRINLDSDGNIQVAWTKSFDTINDPQNFFRGIGYNYFDATSQSWIPGDSNNTNYGLAEKKVGWPSIAPLDSIDEVIFAHTDRLYSSTKGSSNVNLRNLTGSLHQKTGVTFYHSTAEGNTIYVCYDFGQNFYFGRSEDKGQTWSLSDVLIDSICGTPLNPIAAESYDLDAKGDTVAIVAGGHATFLSNEPNDVVLYLSYDRGNTWNCQTIHDFDTINAMPDPNSDGYIVQTPFADVRVMIASDGKIHCTGSVISTLTNPGTLNSSSWFPLTRGIWYWNSDMPDNFDINDPQDYANYVILDSIPDLSTMGHYPESFSELGNYEAGVFSHPSICEGSSGDYFIVFSAVCAGSNNNLIDNKYKRDIYIMGSFNGGVKWSKARNIALSLSVNDVTDGTSGEEAYPVTPKRFESTIPILYQYDSWAGTTLTDNQAILEENKMVVVNFDPYLTVGQFENNNKIQFEIYPNPAMKKARLSFNSENSEEVEITIYNLVGHLLSRQTESVNKGGNSIPLEIDDLERGIFLVTLSSENHKLSKKLVID